jgi:hypothetical protein
VPLVLGPTGERIRAVREALRHERVEIIQWHAEPMRYLSAALGLSYVPRCVLYPLQRRAEMLVGTIDYAAARGWHDTNLQLASTLTSWQLSLELIADSPNWRVLEIALHEKRNVPAEVVGRSPRGLLVRIYDLNGLLPFGQIHGVTRKTGHQALDAEVARVRGGDLRVRVLRLDPDHGTIFVSEQSPAGQQLRLPLF